jgi:predicted nuclease of restriction endonuclease-like (RecB) superfamily
MPLESLPKDYPRFLRDLKERIRAAQVKAVLSVNREMIALYWDLGRQVVERQKLGRWGARIIDQISRDIRAAFPGIKGFSRSNIHYMRAFYLAWTTDGPIVQRPVGQLSESTTGASICPQAVGELPWGQNIVLIDHLQTTQERLWYARQTLEHGWSRPVLIHQIESDLYHRQGKALTNFQRTLPAPQSELAQEMIKNDYLIDFIPAENLKERDIERALVENIRQFLLELGAGFAFVGSQHRLEIGGEDFYIDLLFYHLKLRRYVVIELKIDAFKPEHAGKLGFYLTAVDDLLRHPDDKPSIGLVLCKSNNQVIAEYALRNATKPMSVASYRLTKALPAALAGRLPTTKELEEKLAR